MLKPFNVRVYGILVQNGKVLICDEFIKGREITKFPGGGLELGEGPADCVVREFMEETGLKVEVKSHFYTTDFFVASAFNPQSQVISIYYVVKALQPVNLPVSTRPFDFKSRAEGEQVFRWLEIAEISENDFTFVIDKKVGGMIRAQILK